MSRYLTNYFEKVPSDSRSSAAIAYCAGLDAIHEHSPLVADAIVQELRDQRNHLKLIASENFCSLPVQLAMGNLLTDKYSEGIPGHRFYAGCENVDRIETEAVALAKKLFNASHAYVQPHSGADANMVAFWAILVQRIQSREIEALGKKTLDELSIQEYERVRELLVNQKVMGLSLASGGHLTHGYRHNISAKMFQSVPYDVDPVTGLLDYKQLKKAVQQEKPLILIAGYSAYPRRLNFAWMREIADLVGATLMVDMAHFAGLVAGKVMQGDENPVPFAHVVTSTTHKTLRGPRGGIILCTEDYKEAIDKGCPLVLGGPLPHVLAAKAVAFKEALTPAFSRYAHKIVENAQSLAEGLQEEGIRVLTNGTDNHLVLIDVLDKFGLTGRQAEMLLRSTGLTVNRNAIPQDTQGPWYTSGIRMGTAAVTTLGMGREEMREIASIVASLLRHAKPAKKGDTTSKIKVDIEESAQHTAKRQVQTILQRFPLYPELIIDRNS